MVLAVLCSDERFRWWRQIKILCWALPEHLQAYPPTTSTPCLGDFKATIRDNTGIWRGTIGHVTPRSLLMTMVCAYLSSEDLTTLLLQTRTSSAKPSTNTKSTATMVTWKKILTMLSSRSTGGCRWGIADRTNQSSWKCWQQTSLHWSSASPESPTVRNKANSYWCLETEGARHQAKVRRRGIEPIQATSNSHEQWRCLEVLQDSNAWSRATNPRQKEAPQESMDFRRNFECHRTKAKG